MSDEVEKLKAKNAELAQENADLKSGKKKDIQDKLKRESWEILKYFFEQPATARITTGQIASKFGMTENVAQYHLDVLRVEKLIGALRPTIVEMSPGNPYTTYGIAPRGASVSLA